MFDCYVSNNDSYVPNVSHNITLNLDIYLFYTNLTEEEINESIRGLNSNWNKYGIFFEIVNVDMSKRNKKEIINIGRSNTFLLNQVIEKFNLTTSENNVVIIGNLDQVKGEFGRQIGSIIIVSDESDALSWVLTHEFGHVFGLWDKAKYSGELNLMTHGGCIRNIYHPTNLNQFQAQKVLDYVDSFSRKNL